MQIAMKALIVHHHLEQWHAFFHRANQAHLFHMGISLGWAFAKAEISPVPFLDSLAPWVTIMIYDGMGYFHGLFKVRKTIKSQEILPGIHGNALKGFDQGLGRRLWYNTKGEYHHLKNIYSLSFRSLIPAYVT
jgi:hypothetical protein